MVLSVVCTVAHPNQDREKQFNRGLDQYIWIAQFGTFIFLLFNCAEILIELQVQ
jgi:hypothetical protein